MSLFRTVVKSKLIMYIKPIKHIQNIIDHISPYSTVQHVPRGEILCYKENNINYCYLLLEGSVTLNRRGDGVILNSQHHRFILGVSNLMSSSENLYARTAEPSLLCKMPLERFNLLIEKYALWESYCHLLAYTISSIYEQCTVASQMSSYDIVKFQLEQLILEPSRVRSSVTAANYILDRTFLSRSGIMRILRKLRNDECITLQRGILLGINHLPTKY